MDSFQCINLTFETDHNISDAWPNRTIYFQPILQMPWIAYIKLVLLVILTNIDIIYID